MKTRILFVNVGEITYICLMEEARPCSFFLFLFFFSKVFLTVYSIQLTQSMLLSNCDLQIAEHFTGRSPRNTAVSVPACGSHADMLPLALPCNPCNTPRVALLTCPELCQDHTSTCPVLLGSRDASRAPKPGGLRFGRRWCSSSPSSSAWSSWSCCASWWASPGAQVLVPDKGRVPQKGCRPPEKSACALQATGETVVRPKRVNSCWLGMRLRIFQSLGQKMCQTEGEGSFSAPVVGFLLGRAPIFCFFRGGLGLRLSGSRGLCLRRRSGVSGWTGGRWCSCGGGVCVSTLWENTHEKGGGYLPFGLIF